MAEQPILLPHLQEPMLMAQMQSPRIVDQVRMEPMDVIIQKTAQPEPSPTKLLPMLPQCRGQQRMRGWAGRPRGRPITFPRPSFPMTQFACTMSDWTSMAPPWATMPKDFPDRLEAARQALSQTRGGFGAPSGPGYEPTASALPREQPWNAPSYQ